ncbi:hypothetical protein E2C01_029215 [Portunus trituberculatus]|uniref:Uncharacterized protein n=1 Tax=Portunus trituberculatus TaxID=210409 RepID=A0A5B7EMQ9_PORTR|nr:hypothetical protein [Portunus trituberculatus]
MHCSTSVYSFSACTGRSSNTLPRVMITVSRLPSIMLSPDRTSVPVAVKKKRSHPSRCPTGPRQPVVHCRKNNIVLRFHPSRRPTRPTGPPEPVDPSLS